MKKAIKLYLISDNEVDEIKKDYKKPSNFDKSYEIGNLFSSAGQFGEIYALNSKVFAGFKKFALKRIYQNDAVYLISLLYGLIHLKDLNHRNLMRIYNVFFEEEKNEENEDISEINIIMECLEETLENLIQNKIKTKEFIKTEEILLIFTNICQGLLHLFSKKMIHGDLKPGNIMRDFEHIWKLIDYDTPVSGAIDNIIGTFEYMSPEYRVLLTEEDNEDGIDAITFEMKKKNDIWCLGVILYYMITLKLPYFCKNHKYLQTYNKP